jgi:NAD(P)-dependent dehydrogenase (short-subunit alcohol dehydrogenase family)
MMLSGKVAVVYGAGGAIGGAVARAFAREGAALFVTGNRRAPVQAVADDIVSTGGSAEAGTIDALDEVAVDQHLQYVVDRAGSVASRSTRSGSRTRRSSAYRWSSWMSSSSRRRSRRMRGPTS